ncbi:MAG: tRNA lysidine(34) synthetase TilS [Bacteroidota bacterium]
MFSSRAFLTRFHEYSRRRRLIEERNKIIAAVSGGADSVVMLDLLAREQEAFGLTIIVAHFNHQLRGDESDGDEAHVAQRALHYGFELYVERAHTAEFARHRKIGIQEAARLLRYEFFDKLLVSSGFDKIATAHNADDNSETILLNLFRGAGVQGLSGIPVYREDKKIIRPLLFAERREIEMYQQEERLPFRLDSSNVKDYYTRNFIRHHILPPIKEQVNPNVVQTLHRSAELFRELEAFLTYTARQSFDLMVAKRTEEELHISIPRLRSNPVLMQQYIIMLAGDTFTHKTLEYEQVNAILELTEGLTGSWVSISKEYVVFRDRENLVLRKTEPVPEFRITVQPNHLYEFNKFRFATQVLEQNNVTFSNNSNAEYVDADRVNGDDLILRTWSDGDAFVPLGMKTKKKISDFFVDAKIPIYEKHHIPILETKQGEVVWICGQRIDDRFKITGDTKRVLKLEFSRLTEKANDKGPKGKR